MRHPSLSSSCAPVLVLCGVVFAVGGGCTTRDLSVGKDLDAATTDSATTTPTTDAADTIDHSPPPGGDDGSAVDPPTDRDASSTDVPACSGDPAGINNCGPNCESCSTSLPVPGGAFYRDYDSFLYTDMGNPATVSSFRLDKYEITVARFRGFVDAVVGGWTPAAGSGKHTHLNGGQGLIDSDSGGFETGWNSPWNNNLFTTSIGWNANLACQGYNSSPVAGTWTASPGSNENVPVNCLNWYQAYAFCIWDGGFLPSEAEWNFAASGGSEQRVYPWSSPPGDQSIDCSYTNYRGVPTGRGRGCVLSGPLNLGGAATSGPTSVGRESPKGDARWGQSDMAGNVLEWTLDWHLNYAVPCVDCAYLGSSSQPVSTKVARGGSFDSTAQADPLLSVSPTFIVTSVLASEREISAPAQNLSYFGARCARAP